jgi:hypothetical protein
MDGYPKTLAFLECYLDESGIHGSAQVCTVAGFVGGKGQWKKFDVQWKGVLREFGVSFFHAKEFWGHDEEGHRLGPYVGWNTWKDNDFLSNLTRAIKTYKLYPLSGTIFNEEFLKCSERLRKYLTGGQIKNNNKFVTSGSPNKPYYMAFLLCVTTAVRFVPIGPNSRVHYFCGLDRNMSGYAAEFLKQIRSHPDTDRRECLGNIDFPLSSETAPLQAADLFAYLGYQHALRKMRNWDTKPEELLKACLERSQSTHDHTYLNQEGLGLIISEISSELLQWLSAG